MILTERTLQRIYYVYKITHEGKKRGNKMSKKQKEK